MRRIEFEEIGMENYGPYIEPMILKFINNTLTIIMGKNGIGKTMALDAILFTLYGVTSKGAKGDDVVNNKIGKNCRTWVKFNVNSDKYLVTRYHKYKKISNTVLINKNGVDIKKGHKEVLPEIERLIRPQKAFTNTLFFGQKVKDFYTDLIDSDKKDIFRKILGSDIYVDYYKTADLKLKAIVEQVTKLERNVDINNGRLDDIKHQIQLQFILKQNFLKDKNESIQKIKRDIEDNERLLNQWKNELEKIVCDDDLDLILSQLNVIENQIQSLKDKYQIKLDSLINSANSKKSEIKQGANQSIIELKDEYAKRKQIIQNEHSELKEKLNNIIKEHQDKKHKVELKQQEVYTQQLSIQSSISELEPTLNNSENDLCPTCGQEITEISKEKVLEKIRFYKSELSQLEEQYKECSENVKQISKDMIGDSEIINKKINEYSKLFSKLQDDEKFKLTEINEKLEFTISKIDEAVKIQKEELIKLFHNESIQLKNEKETLISERDEIQSTKQKIAEMTRLVDNLKLTKESLINKQTLKEKEEFDETTINSLKYKINELTGLIEKDKNGLIQLNKFKEVFQFWKTGYSQSGIPSMLIDEAIPFMNRKISEYLEMLSNGRYIVSFDTVNENKSGEFKDKISVKVLDTYTQANSRVQLSGGQTRMIDIATILTLADLNSMIQDVSINIMLFDEVFDSLDDENVKYVTAVANKLKQGRSIYINTHQHQDSLEGVDTFLSFT